LQSELGHWIDDSPRFGAFVAANQDKIRKKLSNADGTDGRLDVRAELWVAHLLLADRRFDVIFEGYGSQRAAPDLSVTYRANLRFNLEVTRLRSAPDVTRLANVLVAKVRQLPAELPNALVIAGHELALTETQVNAAARLLKAHADGRDDAFFAHRGFPNARTFVNHCLRLSGVVVLDDAAAAVFWANREARHPLAVEIVTRLLA
jgi:hypothetical protein